MKRTDLLTAGIPPSTPQFAQVELASEAMKNYEYKWAKLYLNTRGKDLLMNMQFDGKPANKLPFVYKKELGSFVKVEANTVGSNFQGISLDINFTLPLDEILKSKNLLNMEE